MNRSYAAVGLAVLVSALLGGQPAVASVISTSTVYGSSGSQESTGTTSSAVIIDAANFAQSFIDPSAGILRAGVRSDGTRGLRAVTSASHEGLRHTR
jgi:hypothetical protein